ncbi:RICIN domain-containing protein [Limibacter armeniacum]|uniref:RICIN domain-containing protein n=1 Tax=Limibacter armeniacum TaxID=466084 RepID=UPI002FE5D1D5
MKKFVSVLLVVLLLPVTILCAQKRVALSHDGNAHDRDDIPAAVATMALVKKAEDQGILQLVHYHINCHSWSDHDQEITNQRTKQETAMAEGKALWYPNSNVFYNARSATSATITHLKNQINASTASDPLYIIAAGPFEVIYQALAAATQAGRDNTIIISHSNWNENHDDDGANSHDWAETDPFIKAANFVKIVDQNFCEDSNVATGFRRTSGNGNSYADFDWMIGTEYQIIRDKMVLVNRADISDAGMVYYLITNDEYGGPVKMENFLLSGGGGCSGVSDISDLTAVQSGCNTVDLDWSTDPCATAYIVRRKIVGEATYANLATVTGTSYADNSVALGTSYEYQVRPSDGTNKGVSNNPVVNMPATCGTTGYFHIFNKNFGKKIRPYGSGVSQVQASSTGDWTQWEQVTTSGGYFRLKNKGSGQYLSMPDATDEAVITTSTATTNQEEWKTVDTGDGYFHLENRASGKRIRSTSADDYNAAPSGDHTVKVAPSSATGDWTRWEFINVSGARLGLSAIEIQLDNIILYPNPVIHTLSLSGVEKGEKVSLFTLEGKQLGLIELGQNGNVINLLPGWYLIRHMGTSYRFVKK